MRHYNIPIFVPHSGCPNDCSFCNQKNITGQMKQQSVAEVKEEISKHIFTMKGERFVEIAFFGGSFTGIEEERQKELLGEAKNFIDKGKANGIRLSTRPDYINRYILDYLKEYGVTAIELGVQSMKDDVLRANNRGHNSSIVKDAVNLIKSYGCFELGLQQMIGLYGSNPEKDIESAVEIAKLAPDTARIYPTIVLEGTKLKKLYDEGGYVPYTLEEAVEVGSKIYEIYSEKHIRVIRMGLQSTEVINEEEGLIGPYHSSFGELVLSRIIRRNIEEATKNSQGDMVIHANKKMISKIIGNNRCNIRYFKEKYGKVLVVVEDENVEKYIVTNK